MVPPRAGHVRRSVAQEPCQLLGFRSLQSVISRQLYHYLCDPATPSSYSMERQGSASAGLAREHCLASAPEPALRPSTPTRDVSRPCATASHRCGPVHSPTRSSRAGPPPHRSAMPRPSRWLGPYGSHLRHRLSCESLSLNIRSSGARLSSKASFRHAHSRLRSSHLNARTVCPLPGLEPETGTQSAQLPC